MKKITLLLLFTLNSLIFFAQVKETVEEEVIEIMEVEEEEYVEDSDVPFSIIDDAPIFPGCTGSRSEIKKCLQHSIQKHIARKFNTELANELGLSSGKKRVIVMFKIDKTGDIVNVRARGPHERLEKEAIKVINLLPKMIPGKQRGKPIGVRYTLPITILVEDDDKKPETNEVLQEEETIDIVEIEEQDDDEPEDIPFAIIEDAPIFPGCEKLDKNLQKMCLQNQIKKHVAANFNIGLANKLGLNAGKKKVYVVFKIDKNGTVVDLRARGPHKRLEMEAMRVVKLLPKMIPGKLHGKPVGVKYTLPITLLVDDDQKKETVDESEITETEEEINETVSFASVENVPVYPGCKGNESKLRKCLQQSIQKHVAKKFNINLVAELGLSAGKKVVIIIFKINKKGNIVNIRAKAPHKRLEEEGIKVVKMLPKMIPGKQYGIPVDVKYSLPITLTIE